MAEYEIIKASGLQNFLQTYNKNFTLPQDRKIFFSFQSTLPAMDMGSIDIKGSFSLFKQSERYISPVLSLESENNFKIMYNLMKKSAKLDINYPKESSWIKSINYQITPDKTNTKLTQNKINLFFKKNLKISLNNDSNESFIHITNKIKDVGRFKYKYNNKKKNHFQILLNKNIFHNYLYYFNNVEINLNKLRIENKNIHGLMFNYQPSSLLGINALSGVEFNGFNFNNLTLGLHTRHLFNNLFKFENCFVINSNNIIDKIGECGYAISLSYKNNYNVKIKFLKNDIRAFINAKIKNMVFFSSLNFESYKEILHPTKNNFKYSININFK